MCGLFGWAGKNPEEFNYTKLKLMGLLNDERGGDGFGFFNGTEVYKSVFPGRLKEGFKNPEKFHNLLPLKEPVFMGHTRKKSTGKIDLEHTQPIEWIEGGLRSITMHNGTIEDLPELIKQLEMTSIIPDTFGQSDTQVLSRILHQLKLEGRNLSEVLNIYSGVAALLLYFDSEPNGFYIYRGGSKWYDTSTVITEERPLFYSIEKDKGVYVSSLEDSLSYISEGLEFTKPLEVPLNTLIRVEGDNIIEVETIDRSKVYRYGNYKKTTFESNRGNYNYNDYDDGWYKNTHPKGNFPVVNSNRNMGTEFETYVLDGVTIRKNPTFDYISTYFTGFYTLAVDKFKGNHLAALKYLSEVYPPMSIFKYSSGEIPESKEQGSRLIFIKGRYFVISSQSTSNPWGVLANGLYYASPTGIVNYSKIVKEGEKKYGFKHGVLVSLSDPKFVTEVVVPYTAPTEYTMALLKFEYKTLFGNNSPVYKHLVDPVALFYVGGKMFTPTANGEVVVFSGKYEPLFSNIGYNIQHGLVTSSYLIDFEVEKSTVPAKDISKSEKKPEILTLCPECFGEAVLCELCGGDGYLPETLILNYKKLGGIDDEYEELINQQVVDGIQGLDNTVCDLKNTIMSLGDETEFSKEIVILLDSFEKELINIMSNA